LYQTNCKRHITKKRETFLKEWNGIYLIAEPNDESGEHNYKNIKRKNLLTSLIPVTAFAFILCISFLILNSKIQAAKFSNDFSSTGIYLQYFLVLAGLVVSVLLLWYE